MFRITSYLLFLSAPLLVLAGLLPWNNDLATNTDYDPATARRFFDLAVASQLGPNDDAKRQQCFDKSWSDYNYQTVVVKTAVCDSKNNECQMYIAYSAVKNNYVIAFRGTNGGSQLIVESISSLNTYDAFQAGTYNGGGRVNHYFYEGVRSLWPTIKANLGQTNSETTFFITGHSLGGAMASVTAARLSLEGLAPSNQIRLYTFGQPRTWDYQTATAFRDWVPYTWRIVHNSDPVPHGPPMDTSGAKTGPYHHTQEIWYNEKFDSFTRCSTQSGEDGTCSDSLSDFKFIVDVVNSEHLHYFGVKVNDYGAAGCSSAFTHSLFAAFLVVFFKLFTQ
ncbi:unnamed protein product, partial [Mesorhabditis belari]|uniref:Fungal lipase-like domain-containing protein n=1 Tax=Mesorhabditis belari TaxID=2138241 RepID=A0AAF3EE22_9BILA